MGVELTTEALCIEDFSPTRCSYNRIRVVLIRKHSADSNNKIIGNMQCGVSIVTVGDQRQLLLHLKFATLERRHIKLITHHQNNNVIKMYFILMSDSAQASVTF
jgi:hypothetical protein